MSISLKLTIKTIILMRTCDKTIKENTMNVVTFNKKNYEKT